MTTYAQCKLTREEHQDWLKHKRELGRLMRGLDDLSELRRCYGNHKDFELTEKHSKAAILKAEGVLRDFETRMDQKYQESERRGARV